MPRILVYAIRSKRAAIHWPTVEKVLVDFLETEAKPKLLEYFDRVVGPWDEPPEFKARKYLTNKYVRLYVYPAGKHKDKWIRISVTGVKGHPIVPRKGKVLVFNADYRPHTSGGGRYKGPGVAVGEKVVVAYVADWPGFKARNFEARIAEWMRPWFRKHTRNALRRGIYKGQRAAARA
jgi:hypothetical protein